MNNRDIEALRNLSDIEFLKKLNASHQERHTIREINQKFYFKRSIVEYAVKATISTSLLISLICGGPASLMLMGGAILLNVSNLLFNRYHPDLPKLEFTNNLGEPTCSLSEIATYRQHWLLDNQNYLIEQDMNAFLWLKIKIALSLVVGFTIFSILNASLNIPTILFGMCYTYFLIEMAPEKMSPYLEDEASLMQFYKH